MLVVDKATEKLSISNRGDANSKVLQHTTDSPYVSQLAGASTKRACEIHFVT